MIFDAERKVLKKSARITVVPQKGNHQAGDHMVDRFLHLLLRLIDDHDHEFLAQYVRGKRFGEAANFPVLC